MSTRIRLQRGEWFFDEQKPLGKPGGFGAVFEGTNSAGDPVAVKRLSVDAEQAAHRELAIADELAGKLFTNVLVPFDSGLDPDTSSYFVVMPRAERSLADAVSSRGPFPQSDAVSVLAQITNGLLEIPSLVHRDLKPANVLFQDGRWKIADFGIARFLEETTSLNTLKGCLTPDFAAPEQWNIEHATSATDVYALGCIAHVLLSGHPPFAGPLLADFRKQHLTDSPPSLNVHPKLRAIIAAALRKPAEGRPSMARIASVLKEVADNPSAPSPAVGALQAVHASEVERVSRLATVAAEASAKQGQRAQLVKGGKRILLAIMEQFRDVVSRNAPDAEIVPTSSVDELKIRLGPTAGMIIRYQGEVPIDSSLKTWDAVAIGLIAVIQEGRPERRYAATLWYMRLPDATDYRWYEVSYRQSGLVRGGLDGSFAIQDVGMQGGWSMYDHADAAARRAMHTYQMQAGPVAIDDEDSESFIERWIALFVEACKGTLR